jgi:N-acetylglutamate synthase-like GNAT family acetyltransferase
MIDNMKIRQAADNDLPQLLKLVHNTIDISYRNTYHAEAIKAFKDYHSRENLVHDMETGYIIAAAQNDEIIGTGTLLDTNIRRVFISPGWQRYGLGRKIALELEKKARSQGLPMIDLSASLGSKKFWENLGFEFQREAFIPVANDKKLVYFEMSKPLD